MKGDAIITEEGLAREQWERRGFLFSYVWGEERRKYRLKASDIIQEVYCFRLFTSSLDVAGRGAGDKWRTCTHLRFTCVCVWVKCFFPVQECIR